MIKSFIKSTGFIFLGNVLSKILSLLTLSLIGRFLGPNILGSYNAVISTGTSINQILDFGSSIVIQKEAVNIEDKKNSYLISLLTFYLSVQFGVVLFIIIISIINADYILKLLFENEFSTQILYFLIPLVVLNLLIQMLQQLLLGLGLFKEYASRIVIVNLISFLTFIITFFIFGNSLYLSLVASIISLLFNVMITYFLISKYVVNNEVGLSKLLRSDKTKSTIYNGFIYYIGNTLVGAIVTLSLIGLFSNFISIKDFGYMRIGASLSAILGVFIGSLQPVTIRLLSNSDFNANRLKSFQLRVVTCLLFIGIFFIVAFINPIISLLFGDNYLEGKQIIVFMLLMQIIIFVSSLISNFQVAANNTKFIGVISAGGALLNLILSFLLIPKYGIYGFYLSHFLGYIFGAIMLVYKEMTNNIYDDRQKIYLAFSSILFGTFLLYLFDYIAYFYIQIFAQILTLSFLGAIFYKYILSEDERDISKKILLNNFNKFRH